MGRTGPQLTRAALRWSLLGVVFLSLVVLPLGPAVGTSISHEQVTVYRSWDATFETRESVETAIANGTLEPAGNVTVGDTLVVVIESERLAETIENRNGSPTSRFFAALRGDAEFRIIQTNPTTMQNRKVAVLGPENVTAFRNGTSVYAVIDTTELSFIYRRVNRTADVYHGNRFAVQFGYDLPDDWSRSTVPESPIIEFQPRSALVTESPTATASPTPTPTEPQGTTTPTPSPVPATSTSPSTNRSVDILTPGFTALTAVLALLVLGAGLRRRE